MGGMRIRTIFEVFKFNRFKVIWIQILAEIYDLFAWAVQEWANR